MFYQYVKTRQFALRQFSIALTASLFVAGCASGPVQVANDHIAHNEWMKAVLVYRKAAAEHPGDVEFNSRLKQTELKGADYYYQRGAALLEQNDVEGAIVQFQQGLAVMPDYSKLLQAMRQALLRKEANSLYVEALRLLDAGQTGEARLLLKRAVEMYPEFNSAADKLAQLDRMAANDEEAGRLKVTSRSRITLNFRQTDLRTAFEFIAKSFGIDVVFDEGVKTMPVTLFAKDVTFEEALNLILSTSKTFYKRVGQNTILIAPDNKEKRGQYEDQLVRVFQLTNIYAKEMADILKGIIPLNKIIVNDALNTIVIRDSEEAIKVAGKVIRANDRRPAEIVLEVEILEVNRSKAERLGLDLSPYRIGAAVPAATPIPLTGSIRRAFSNNAILTLPAITFNFYKQDVDAKTLANPRLRVLSGKNAKIHIGDRVPLRASVIQDATGQVRTTYDYKEIGIMLAAQPVIHLDNSVTVKVNLEVSSLGQNIGTQNEPAYSIGTRNAETFMLLRDGETAILGGLIRDEDRKTRLRVPGFGDIPGVGTVFTSSDDSGGRTDVLLTITPRVVRGWDIPERNVQMFTSGSVERLTSQPLLGEFAAPDDAAGAPRELPRKVPAEGKPPAPQDDAVSESAKAPVPSAVDRKAAGPQDTGESSAPAKTPLAPPAPPVAGTTPTTSVGEAPVRPAPVQPTAGTIPTSPVSGAQQVSIQGQPLLAFSESVVEGNAGKEFEIKLTGENLDGVTGVSAEVLFNPQLVKYVRSVPGNLAAKNSKIEPDEAHGVLRIKLDYPENTPVRGGGVLARIVMRGDRPGTSYIVYRAPTLSTANGDVENVQVRASRVVVK
ncbi:MAG TPA: secretin N-terminal domain-containing protein [Gallionella sp.]|nr:secretin N-terminal domain-containing protein [Gallionella sp.]